MASEYSNPIRAAANFTVDLVRGAHYGFAARWPHGMVGKTPASRREDLIKIGQWMKIPWPMRDGVPAPDFIYREILKRPFTHHRASGTIPGIIEAVEALGYSNVTYIDYTALLSPPTWPGGPGGSQIMNENAFGLSSSSFPRSWSGASPAVTPGSDLDILIRTIKSKKRASSTLWELRLSEAIVASQEWSDAGRDPDNVEIVVSQEWWEGGQDPDLVEIVVTES